MNHSFVFKDEKRIGKCVVCGCDRPINDESLCGVCREKPYRNFKSKKE